ncbi:hypothetical protein ALC60_06551 [Trachymyrmex zeteki]|uniref:Uncharacterized protein n=1 Tax=Mycetomoellerius zeteki TaxID=64791 RepID=A0A151X2I8_9HYME|nr:hypothetical protein ALC60_06551 [Trachymyrmex zeteki]
MASHDSDVTARLRRSGDEEGGWRETRIRKRWLNRDVGKRGKVRWKRKGKEGKREHRQREKGEQTREGRERDRGRVREEYNIDRISVAADSIYPLLTGLLLSRI